MSPRTSRPTAQPIATTGAPHTGRRVRRAAALPMPDGASMTPLAPADPLGAGHDESTLRSLSSVLAASRTPQQEAESDPAAWRPRGTDEAGQEPTAGTEGAAPVAGPAQRRSGAGRLTSKIAERPFLVAAAVAGAVVASTPFMTSNAKDHTTTYEGLGKADPVAVEGGGAADRHPDAYPGEMPLQDSVTGGAATSADNLLNPEAGAWHGSGAAAGDTAADTAQVPGVLAADPAGSGAGTPDSGTAVAAAQPRQGADTQVSAAADKAGHPVVATDEKGTPAKATDTADGAKTPAKTTVMAAAVKPATSTTTKSDTTPVAARVAAVASTGAGAPTTTSPTAAGEALTPVDGGQSGTSGTSSEDRAQASSSSAADDTAATDRQQATDTTTATDTKADDTTPATDRQQAAAATGSATAATTASDTATDQSPAADAAPQWSTKVLTSAFTLRSGESVNSNRMRITMRAGGDLVVSDENGTVRWSSHTTGENNYATFKADGELVVRSAYQQTLWSSQTGGHTGAKLVIQNDGNVTILSADDQTLWAADTQH
ncbi:hypothetical protein [Streptomyces sp. NPDC001068]|uniref:hypothetical protein n=1 Tax=Streptomyces sp. NPDC001068 TaxID=3364544 RepID=UPI00368D560B